MAIQDDFTVAQNGNIRYVGAAHGAAGAGYYTVIQFHRWLGDLADDAVASASSSDFLDITDATPSERSTDNIITLLGAYNIDDTAAEHLYDGSIIQASGAEIYDGLVVIANRGMDLQIVQNGTVIVNDFWNSVPNGSSFKGLNSDPAQGYSHRFMLKVRTAGADIDGRRLIGQTRVFGFSYSEFRIGTGTQRGNNVLAVTYATDLNNQTLEATVSGWTTITNVTEGYNLLDVDNNSVNEAYYSEWNKDAYTINQFYERMKWLGRQGSASTIYGLNGELFRGITHQWAYDAEAGGPFVEATAVTWGSGATAGTGQLLALLDSGTTGTMWIQLLTGVPPVDNMTINQTGGKTCLVNGSVTERDVPAKASLPFCGQSTGSSIVGAFGFGIESTDLTASDKVFDLTNTQITPPNYVTFTVNGLVSGEDYVLVGPESGGTLNTTQFTLQTTLSAANVTSVVANAAIPTDTPSAGTIRVADNNGVFRRLVYTSYAGSTFTIDPTASELVAANVADFNTVGATAGNSLYISYIDKLATAATASFTSVFLSTRPLYVRVRDGGGSPIKTFETTASLGAGGGSATAIRTSDA
jgi:hypothetical protein